MGTHGRGRPGAGPSTGSHHSLSASAWRDRMPLLLAVAAVLLLLGGAFAAGVVFGPGASTGDASPSPAAATGPDEVAPATNAAFSHPTLLGEVVRVDTGDEIVARVDGEEIDVRILGIDAPDTAGPGRSGQCGAAAALTFADEQLAGQTVTLVPDPTVPETDEAGRRLAYVVLRSQLSYTDAALLAGVVAHDTSRPLWYSPVFDREQTQAVDEERGVWGPPCDAAPGRPLPMGS